MKVASKVLLGLFLLFGLVVVAGAADEKQKGKKQTLKGEILCTKCALKETAKCGNAIVVEKGGKKTTYYFEDKGAKEKYHKNICRGPKQGSVTGVVFKKGEKWYIKPQEVTYQD